MSMFSAIDADINNEIKKKWDKKLKEAFDKKDWDLMEIAIKEIADFYFTE
jgi:hypothetical protein